MEDTDKVNEEEVKLTAAQRAQVERNRQRALLLKQSRIAAHPYLAGPSTAGTKMKGPPRIVDTGAGFFREEGGEEEEKSQVVVKHPEGPVMAVDNLLCESCGKEFLESFFYNQFDVPVCDSCRQNEEKYPLISKTDAKSKYLLQDSDLDKREPPLRFIVRKNPHNQRWGEMKLYLEAQVLKRALEIWDSEEQIEEERIKRQEKRELSKQKKFDKKVKELRLAVRSSLIRKESSAHQHEFGDEKYDEDEDMYSKTCRTCGHTMTYEKM